MFGIATMLSLLHREPTLICKLQMEIILESAVVRREDSGSCFTMCKLCSSRRINHCWFHNSLWGHVPFVIILSRFIVGY